MEHRPRHGLIKAVINLVFLFLGDINVSSTQRGRSSISSSPLGPARAAGQTVSPRSRVARGALPVFLRVRVCRCVRARWLLCAAQPNRCENFRESSERAGLVCPGRAVCGANRLSIVYNCEIQVREKKIYMSRDATSTATTLNGQESAVFRSVLGRSVTRCPIRLPSASPSSYAPHTP